jgi:hypothetical protein
MSTISYRRSLQTSKQTISRISKNEIYAFFLCLWSIFALLDPDPDCNPDPDTDPRAPLTPDPNTDLDPQHWIKHESR